MAAAPLANRALPEEQWDVIVAGGGPAGCAAAAAAAAEGARTLLVETTGALGGMGTMGLVPAFTPFADGVRIIYRGLALRVFDAMKRGMPHIRPDATEWVPIDPERLKRVYDDIVLESGAKVRFLTQACAVDVEDGRITTLYVANKAGLTALKAKVFVDTTGDADLAAWAGVPIEKGDSQTGALQPATGCFVVSGVNDYGYKNGPWLHPHNADSPVHAAFASGKYPLMVSVHFCNSLLGPGTVGFNAGHVPHVDATDPDSLSDGLRRGRALAAQMHDMLREAAPAGFAGSMLAQTGALLGIRETRRIVGDYVLTVDDYAARRSFEDDIGRNNYYLDIHRAPGSHPPVAPTRYGKGESHGIPYRCLLPKGVENLLVAGRSISTERHVNGSVRVMPPCLVTGEAAGVAARMAVAGDGRTRGVDVSALRARLLERGAYLGESDGKGGCGSD